MKYIKFSGGNGYCGCEFEEYQAFDDNVSEETLGEIAGDLAQNNAESYEYVATGWDEDFESEEDRNSYYEDVYCGWEEVTKEEYEENQ